MKKLDKNNPATLPEWLEIATQGLAAPGKERIVREIEAHYAEAIQARVAQGEPSQTAETGIIADLGDPKVAARRFRRSHFTTLEAKCIANLSRQRREIPRLIFGLLPPVIFLLVAIFHAPLKLLIIDAPPLKLQLIVGALMFALMICRIFSFIISRRPASKARTLSILYLEWVNELATAFMIVPMCFLPLAHHPGLPIFLVAGLFFQGVSSFLSWNRARKMADELDETTGLAS